MGRRFLLWVLSYAWIALLAGLGLLAADSELNAANIDLVGLTANGLPYV